MAHIEDRWYTTVQHPDGRTERVKSDRFGTGLRYRVRYIDPAGRSRNKSFPDRRKRYAEAFMLSLETDKLRGSYIDPAAGRMTFGEFAAAWLRTQTFDESTLESVEIRVRKYILPFFGPRPLAAIRPGLIREWDSGLVGKLAPSTRSVTFAYLRMILSAAVDDERIAKNPCMAKSVKQPRAEQRKVVPWDLTTVLKIRAGLPKRYQLAVDLGAGCGARQGEIFGLAEDDFDLDGGWLHIRRQVKRVRSRLLFGLPKNDKERRVPLPETIAAAVRAHLDVHPPVAVTLPWESPAGPPTTVRLVFTTTRRNAINRGHFNDQIWHPALTAAGIVPTRETGMHALRHSYASALLDGGESIKVLSEYLGHSDPAFTLRVYTHLMPSTDRRTRTLIDDLYRGVESGRDVPGASHGGS